MEKNQSKLKYKDGRKIQKEQSDTGKKLSRRDKELLKAVRRGNTELVKEKLEREKGYIDMSKALIEAKADVNVKNVDDVTALHLSSRNGHIDIVKALIAAKADVNIKDIYDNTALHLSSRNGRIDIAKTLMEAKADVNVKYMDNQTDVKKQVEEIIRSAIPESDSVEVIGVGSSFEGTKNGLPDELDFIIKLFHVKSSCIEQEGYGKMERDEKEVKRLNIIGSYGMWLWQKLMTYWLNA
ncbi:alpha-latrotoxin-Lp1a-like [Lineus longissimus]|uniref:alpha-latrotoxin-Lp1a-like n=1 Tax=Lineus longissimus TaxID=88925 RepID=UPI00315CCA06